MIAYLLAGAGGLAIIAGGWAYVERQQNEVLRHEIAAVELQLGACEARADNMTEDKRSDDEVDRIPDDGLRDAPDRWMRQAPGAGGVY